jgi:hypothetical protein
MVDHINTSRTITFRLTYRRLETASTELFTTVLSVDNDTTSWDPVSSTVTIPSIVASGLNLQVRQVYTATFELLTESGGRVLTGFAGNSPTISPVFYFVTGGTTGNSTSLLQRGRLQMVVAAFKELGDSELGLVGRRGTEHPDGSRYTGSYLLEPRHGSYHPQADTEWCDWFYRWIGIRATDSYDGTPLDVAPVVYGGVPFWNGMDPNFVASRFKDPAGDGCASEFGDPDGDGIVKATDPNGNGIFGEVYGIPPAQGCGPDATAYPPNLIQVDLDDNQYAKVDLNSAWFDKVYSRPANHAPGDFIAMNHHVGMFLAFDPNGGGDEWGTDTNTPPVGTVWTIEGNNGQQVRVRTYVGNSDFILGYGRLRAQMFAP